MKKASNFDNIVKIAGKSKGVQKTRLKLNSKRNNGYVVPKWFKSLPVGSHGSTPSQKKAWKVVSDYVRQRDFLLYNGECVSCDFRFSDWHYGHAGHFKPWTMSNAMHKFSTKGIALQCPTCNYNLKRSNAVTGHIFAEKLQQRLGPNILRDLEQENKAWEGKKIEEWMLVDMVAKLAPHLVK